MVVESPGDQRHLKQALLDREMPAERGKGLMPGDRDTADVRGTDDKDRMAARLQDAPDLAQYALHISEVARDQPPTLCINLRNLLRNRIHVLDADGTKGAAVLSALAADILSSQPRVVVKGDLKNVREPRDREPVCPRVV